MVWLISKKNITFKSRAVQNVNIPFHSSHIQYNHGFGCFQKIGVGPPNHPILIGLKPLFSPSILGRFSPYFLLQHPFVSTKITTPTSKKSHPNPDGKKQTNLIAFDQGGRPVTFLVNKGHENGKVWSFFISVNSNIIYRYIYIYIWYMIDIYIIYCMYIYIIYIYIHTVYLC